MKQNKNGMDLLYHILPVLSILLIFVAWIALTAGGGKVFPTPGETFDRLIKTFTIPIAKTTLLGHIWASLRRVMIALVIAWAVGIGVGILVGSNKYCKAIIGSILEIFRPIPPIAWIPIIIMWFGVGELPKVILVFIGTFFPVMVNTAAGIALVDKSNVNVGIVFGGNHWQIMKDIVIPTALPSIFAGIRTSVSSGWTVVLAAEMMGAQQVLGALVMKGWSITDMALVLVSVITIAIIGALLALLISKAERLVTPWTR